MIAVIADDFTGAAEIGGIGLRHGLKVVIETTVEKVEGADVLVIVADTRSMPAVKAVKEIEKITRELLALQPEYIYKKLDSVLRGNIADELQSQMDVSGKNRSLIIAGNPHFKRLIKNGIYYVDDVPLADTFFANDPEYAIKSSTVIDLISTEKLHASMMNVDGELAESGILVGNISNVEDMLKWGQKITKNTIPAGGAGFFETLLEQTYDKVDTPNALRYNLGKSSLWVFGSTFPKKSPMVSGFEGAGLLVSNMPEEIYLNKNFDQIELDHWASDVVEKIRKFKRVIVLINHTGSTEPALSMRIRENVGQLIQKVFEQVDLDELLIEGGASASSILKYLGIRRLFPSSEVDAGVIQMQVSEYPNLRITTKPGSYSWPDRFKL